MPQPYFVKYGSGGLPNSPVLNPLGQSISYPPVLAPAVPPMMQSPTTGYFPNYYPSAGSPIPPFGYLQQTTAQAYANSYLRSPRSIDEVGGVSSDAEAPSKVAKISKIEWIDDVDSYKVLHPTRIYEKGRDLEAGLAHLVHNSAGVGKDVLVDLFHRVPVSAQLEFAQEVTGSQDIANATKLLKSIETWCHLDGHVSHRGPLPKMLQNMKYGIGCAILCDRDDETTDAFYMALLGCSSGVLQKMKKHSDSVRHTPGATFNMGLGGTHTDEFMECQTAKKWCVWDFLHSYYGSRIESHSTQIHHVLDPCQVVCDHPHRSYHDVGKEKLYERFLESPQYAEYLEHHPKNKICSRSFEAMLCPCAGDPKAHACVDTIYGQIHQYCRALMHALTFDKDVKEVFSNCNCGICAEMAKERNGYRHLIGPMPRHYWIEHHLPYLLQARPDRICMAACCESVPRKELRAPRDVKDPRVLKFDCWRGECDECGVDNKLKPLRCEGLASCNRSVKTGVYKEEEVDGVSQKVLTFENMKVSDVVKKLNEILPGGVSHCGREKWLKRINDLNLQTSGSFTIVIDGDFSATVRLHPACTENSAHDTHSVLLILVVAYNFRDATVEHKDKAGNVVRTETVRLCDTDYWHFWGPTGGKCKKNDHVFYNDCRAHVIAHYKAEFARQGSRLIRIITWSDQCPTQFRCIQSYSRVAESDEVWQVITCHYFDESQSHKSVDDAVGKAAKEHIWKGELSSISSPNSSDCVVHSICVEKERQEKIRKGKGHDWHKLEADKSPLLLRKGILTCNKKFHVCVAESQAEYDLCLSKGIPRESIILSSRKASDEYSGCKDSDSFKAFEGRTAEEAKLNGTKRLKENQYALDMKALPCACSVCQENAAILEQEILTGNKFEGPRNQCPFYDDVASTDLPVEGKVRYGKVGVCTIFRHVPVADVDLYGYINPFFSRDKSGNSVMDSTKTNQQLTMQLRSRGKSVGGNKDSKIRALIDYLIKDAKVLREEGVIRPPTATLQSGAQVPAQA